MELKDAFPSNAHGLNLAYFQPWLLAITIQRVVLTAGWPTIVGGCHGEILRAAELKSAPAPRSYRHDYPAAVCGSAGRSRCRSTRITFVITRSGMLWVSFAGRAWPTSPWPLPASFLLYIPGEAGAPAAVATINFMGDPG